MRCLLLLPLMALLLPAPPARAQPVTRICTFNPEQTIVLRSRLQHTDLRDARHAGHWQALSPGQRHCVQLQDAISVLVEFEYQDTRAQWRSACSVYVEGRGRDTEVLGHAPRGTSPGRCTFR